MNELLTGPKKIVDGLTEMFRGLTRMCEGVAEQIELLEFTAEDPDEEMKPLPERVLPVNTAPKAVEIPHPRKKPVKRSRRPEVVEAPAVEEPTPADTEETPAAEDTAPAEETAEDTVDTDFPDSSADALSWDEDTGQKAEAEKPAVTISKDEITAVIVAKIKQKRSNNEKIGQLLKTYGVDQLSELPADKYEAFLADISQL